MEMLKFIGGKEYEIETVASTDTELKFSLKSADTSHLESFLKEQANARIISLFNVDEETQDTFPLKKYAGYTKLKSIKTEYDIVTKINYEIQDETTVSGFEELRDDITTVVLEKPNFIELELQKLRVSLEAGQAVQDGAIMDVAEIVSVIADTQEGGMA